ncbi:NAD(P)/FAD-dependent oxidoreductase [Stappia sp. ES.058]|uniref:dihydrolipoyl dehydrogenase family protein n=1 Tax=Stappia sp. ES.058 TaxID=1881061 RepID=UPI00087A1231|nr:FAD-dependent oxidoreductase [Stappia sp. ES.058]SDT89308.1 Pyruvate/2-oxoglutarate dehydrogenase complex, dihydrolipoamide dehydrogenase (E3) component [Stappia sp. ES.058]
MTRVLTPDICVIGAGSGGLSVAAAAAAFGVDVVLIEKAKMGGDCLNYGCVPSKALIASAKAAHHAAHATALGVSVPSLDVDFQAVHDHVHGVIGAIAPHDSVERFEGLGVEVVQETARFVDHRTVRAGDTDVRARRFVVATGSSPAVPPIPGLDAVPYLTNETIFDLAQCPQHLIVVGGGPIGLELAQAHRRLGGRVTVVEAQRALAKESPDLAAIVLERLRDEGLEILEETKVAEVSGTAGDIKVSVEDEDGRREIAGTHLLVAAGRKPNLDGLGLDEAGIDHTRGGITVGADLRTSNKKVYAIGDIAGGLQFTHVAGYHAGIVIRAILFRLPAKENRAIIPWVTFTDPQIGHVGMTQAEARTEHGHHTVKILDAPFSANDRAQAERRTDGLVRLMVGKRGRVVGADVVGPAAGEIVNLLSLVVSKGLTVRDLAGFVSPYPTLSEAVRRAAISYYADSANNPWVRRVVRLLASFG